MTSRNKGKNNPMFGRHHSEETKRKIGEGRKGKNHSEEAKRKMSEAHKGKNHPFYGKRGIDAANWKGGQVMRGGYIFVFLPDHPEANCSGYVRKSHLIAEEKLGRYLYPDEITHHKNEIKNDDRPENIEVTTQSKHASFHRKIQELRRHQNE